MDFPLSKSEKRQLKELEDAFSECNPLQFEDDDSYLEIQDLIRLLIERQYIEEIEYQELNGYSFKDKIGYKLKCNFDIINDWVADQERKAKKKTRREWKIAIISGVIGAVIGLTPTFLQLLGG